MRQSCDSIERVKTRVVARGPIIWPHYSSLSLLTVTYEESLILRCNFALADASPISIMSKKRYSMWDAEEKDTKRQQREAKLEQSMRDEQLKSSQAWMLNGKYTHVSISCKSKEFRAHRIVLSRCRFFESCFEHGFKETESRLITLDDDDPDALEAVLTFLYTMSASFLDDKEETCWTNTKNVSELMQYLVNVAILADKYSLPMLLEAVKVRLEDDDQSSNRRNLSRWSVGLLGAIALIPRHTESADLSDLRKALNQEGIWPCRSMGHHRARLHGHRSGEAGEMQGCS